MLAIDAPSPFGRLCFDCSEAQLEALLDTSLPPNLLQSCRLVRHSATRYALQPRLRGGKGGFGSQLRAAGSRMKRKKTSQSVAKDVSGRRIATLKQAKQLAEALRDLPEREAAAREEKRAQLTKCVEDAEGYLGRRIKFEDEAYLEVSERLLEGIQQALEAAYEEEAELEEDEEETASSTASSDARAEGSSIVSQAKAPRKLAGWDDDDESGDDVQEHVAAKMLTAESDQSNAESSKDPKLSTTSKTTGKGKAKATRKRK